ncbi:MAG: transposase [Elusimicrobia bacterium]|nr:transposase [Elusimicrobiota bacterium]
MLVTSSDFSILTLAQMYRDRADAENNFDELKYQWGWGGFTTRDYARCQLVTHMVALVYNGLTLFVRLAQPDKHFETISSRPLLLHGVATQTRHGGQTCLTITSTHQKQAVIQSILTNIGRLRLGARPYCKVRSLEVLLSSRQKTSAHRVAFYHHFAQTEPHSFPPNGFSRIRVSKRRHGSGGGPLREHAAH